MLPESLISERDGRLQVPIEYIEWLELERQKINKVDLANIDFVENGVKLDIPLKRIKRFKFVGLTNVCFILTGFYLEKAEDDPFWEKLKE